MKKIFQLASAAALALGMASAQAVSLFNLVDSNSTAEGWVGELTVGDKRFYDWTIIDASLDLDDWQLDYRNMEVTGDDSDPMNIGLIFDFGTELTVVDDEFGDFWFAFSVEVLDPSKQIVGVELNVTGFDNDDTAGYVSIFEGVNASAIDDPTLSVDSDFGPWTSDSAAIPAAQSIRIEKNILIGGLDGGDFAQLGTLEQRFRQASVPLPAPLALLALGLLGIGWSRRRH